MLASTMQFSNNQHSRKHNHPFPENPTTCPTRPLTLAFHAEAVLTKNPDRAE
jgi:hypothetical protein